LQESTKLIWRVKHYSRNHEKCIYFTEDYINKANFTRILFYLFLLHGCD
uniref:Ovule protein n=1 Tax=Hymenolepis diminuta TaxID=6216 RepID=A0A0R3SBR9_HYMDI